MLVRMHVRMSILSTSVSPPRCPSCMARARMMVHACLPHAYTGAERTHTRQRRPRVLRQRPPRVLNPRILSTLQSYHCELSVAVQHLLRLSHACAAPAPPFSVSISPSLPLSRSPLSLSLSPQVSDASDLQGECLPHSSPHGHLPLLLHHRQSLLLPLVPRVPRVPPLSPLPPLPSLLAHSSLLASLQMQPHYNLHSIS